MSEEVLGILVNVGVVGALALYIKLRFNTLQDRVDSLRATVDAQKEALDVYRNLLASLDEAATARRMKGYKETVDHEKAAFQEGLERDFYTIIAELMPYAPPERRKIAMDLTNFSEPSKATFYRLADAAPDLSPRFANLDIRSGGYCHNDRCCRDRSRSEETIMAPSPAAFPGFHENNWPPALSPRHKRSDQHCSILDRKLILDSLGSFIMEAPKTVPHGHRILRPLSYNISPKTGL
jgi:hypothetical protein